MLDNDTTTDTDSAVLADESADESTYTGLSATYSPEDNKLRLYSLQRLPRELYDRVKAQGFKWAPKQELFVAPMWTPARAAFLVSLCGDIGDEDTSLVARAEQRAERFDDYSDSRRDEARSARDAVSKIADAIPFGQPILVGHHSERRARKDAERIQDGMRKAVKLWDTADYWQQRAAGALAHAKYKELPTVRARRIKGLEADLRKQSKIRDDLTARLKLWTKLHEPDSIKRKDGAETTMLERALYLTNHSGCDGTGVILADGSRYWSTWGALNDGKITPEEAQAQKVKRLPAYIRHAQSWIDHLQNRLTYERAMLAEAGGLVSDQVKPEKGGAVRCLFAPHGGWAYIVKVNRITVTIRHSYSEGGRVFGQNIPFDKIKQVMTAAQVEEARQDGRLTETSNKVGFYLTAKPEPTEQTEPSLPTDRRETNTELNDRMRREAQAKQQPDAAEEASFRQMRHSAKDGIRIVTAPQLFPTPVDLARRMVQLAGVKPGQRVLEPQAGTGVVCDAILSAFTGADCGQLVAVEINQQLADGLRDKRIRTVYATEENYRVICDDFLTVQGLGLFDAIVMNPPFENGIDIVHILHARGMLKPGGTLSALCAAGPRQIETLRPLVTACGGLWELQPDDTFAKAGTRVRTVLLTLQAGELTL